MFGIDAREKKYPNENYWSNKKKFRYYSLSHPIFQAKFSGQMNINCLCIWGSFFKWAFRGSTADSTEVSAFAFTEYHWLLQCNTFAMFNLLTNTTSQGWKFSFLKVCRNVILPNHLHISEDLDQTYLSACVNYGSQILWHLKQGSNICLF